MSLTGSCHAISLMSLGHVIPHAAHHLQTACSCLLISLSIMTAVSRCQSLHALLLHLASSVLAKNPVHCRRRFEISGGSGSDSIAVLSTLLTH